MLTAPTRDDWLRLAATISNRMDELQITKAELLRSSGWTGTTLAEYLDGRPRTKWRADKLRDLSVALGWSGDYLDRVLRGEDPGPPPSGHGGTEGWPVWLEEWLRGEISSIREMMERLAQRVAALEHDDDRDNGPPPVARS